MTTGTAQGLPELLPCPFCDNTPYFEGDAGDWQDESRYVQLLLKCCVTMSGAIGWRKARDMTVEARTAEIQADLTTRWNTRAAQAAQPAATVPDNMQDWAGMDGAIAWHLIERHADNWSDIGKMMGEWLAANQPAAKALSDAEIDAVTDAQWGSRGDKPIYAAHRAYARAIEAAHGIHPDGKEAEYADTP